MQGYVYNAKEEASTWPLLIWEQVYSRVHFVLKASHQSRGANWALVNINNFGGSFVTR